MHSGVNGLSLAARVPLMLHLATVTGTVVLVLAPLLSVTVSVAV